MEIDNHIKLIGLKNIPLIKEGDNISEIILESLRSNDLSLEEGDLIVIAQTIISKSNGRIRNLKDITPSEKALKLFKEITPKIKTQGLPIKKPELIQAILDESKEILKADHVLITETKNGFVCANAGIDKSNVKGKDNISLLPENADKDADKIRKTLKNLTNKNIGVIITDSFGRPFRIGSVGVAIGVSGIKPILDKRGTKDLYGYELQTTIIGNVDNVASAAQLLMGETNEGIPIVLIKGYKYELDEKATIQSIIRDKQIDLFRENETERFFSILRNRRSYKLPFKDKLVDKTIIYECIKIARWAPSAHNGQHWRYIILEQGKTRRNLINKINEKLRNDLQKEGRSIDYVNRKINKTRKNFLKAPVLILLCLDTTDLEIYPTIERTQNEFILGIQSVSNSAIYLLLAFELKKLAACWYCAPLFVKDIIVKTLNLPQSYTPTAFFTVGYPTTSVKAPVRKNVEDIIFKLKI